MPRNASFRLGLKTKEFILVSFLGLLVALAVTFPAGLRLSTQLCGLDDSKLQINNLWWAHYAVTHGLNPLGTNPFMMYPTGLPMGA